MWSHPIRVVAGGYVHLQDLMNQLWLFHWLDLPNSHWGTM